MEKQKYNCIFLLSHPSRVRGLKYFELVEEHEKKVSHPSRVRGLKFEHSEVIKSEDGRTLRGCVD